MTGTALFDVDGVQSQLMSSAEHDLSSIHGDGLAGDERSRWRGEIRDHGGYLIDTAETGYGLVGGPLETDLWVQSRWRRVQRAGRDGVDGDPERSEFDSQRTGHAEHT